MSVGSTTPSTTTPDGHAGVRPGVVLLCAAGATFLAFLDTTVVNIAFPALQQDFRTSSLADLSWVLTGYGTLFAALLTPAGRLADVVGRRQFFVLSVIAFTVASVLVAAAPTVPLLIAARVVQGGAAAGMIPSALGLVLGHTPAVQRTTAVGLWAGAGSMAAALGPSLGGLLIEVFNWRAIFLINIPLGLGLAVLTYRQVPRDLPSGRRLPDPLGTLLLVAGVGLGVLGLTEGANWGWRSGATVGCLAAAVLLLPLAVLRSMRHPAPAVETDLWRSRIFLVTNIGSFLFGASVFAWLLLGPIFLTFVWHYSVLKAGLAISPGALASAAAAVIVGRRASARGRQVVVVVGSLLLAATAIWFYREFGSEPRYLELLLPVNLISGVAIGAVLTALSSAAATSVPPTRFAAGTGLVITARQFGGALGIAAMAAILTAGQGLTALLDVALFCGIAAGAAALPGLVMFEREPRVVANVAPTTPAIDA
jgi:EmrB/QacA subfamily drug resistance transporter